VPEPAPVSEPAGYVARVDEAVPIPRAPNVSRPAQKAEAGTLTRPPGHFSKQNRANVKHMAPTHVDECTKGADLFDARQPLQKAEAGHARRSRESIAIYSPAPKVHQVGQKVSAKNTSRQSEFIVSQNGGQAAHTVTPLLAEASTSALVDNVHLYLKNPAADNVHLHPGHFSRQDRAYASVVATSKMHQQQTASLRQPFQKADADNALRPMDPVSRFPPSEIQNIQRPPYQQGSWSGQKGAPQGDPLSYMGTHPHRYPGSMPNHNLMNAKQSFQNMPAGNMHHGPGPYLGPYDPRANGVASPQVYHHPAAALPSMPYPVRSYAPPMDATHALAGNLGKLDLNPSLPANSLAATSSLASSLSHLSSRHITPLQAAAPVFQPGAGDHWISGANEFRPGAAIHRS
jgi:hypothetical protein